MTELEQIADCVRTIKYALVPYTRGRVLEIGSSRPFPHFIGADIGDTALFADGTMDAVFSAVIQKLDDPDKALKQAWRVLKPGGHLVVHEAPEETVKRLGTWDMVFESGGWRAYQKGGPGHRFSGHKPKAAKRAIVIRYGGFGDMIQTASLLPALKEAGYHVTVNCYAAGQDLLKADPNVDAFLVQERDQVPNEELGEYWAWLETQYDKVVNLSESVEGSLLALPGRTPFFWTTPARHLYMNRNYLEMTHAIAGVDAPFRPHFHPTPEEREWAIKERTRMGGNLVILYSLSGSSVHKVWPYFDQIVARLLVTFPQARIVTVGDKLCQTLECGWENEPRVVRRSGEWSIRETLTFAVKQADLVIGPETGVLNAVGHEPVGKVCFLSHSSIENLTKHWSNTVSLAPHPSVACYPCHKMIYHFGHCNKDTATGTAACQAAISADVVWAAMLGLLKKTGRLPDMQTGAA